MVVGFLFGYFLADGARSLIKWLCCRRSDHVCDNCRFFLCDYKSCCNKRKK